MKIIGFSAFVEDMRVDKLPEEVRRDVDRFVEVRGHHLLPHYGMVVPELVDKADPVNMRSAREHVRAGGRGKDELREEVLKATRSGRKYVLVMNDRMVDGHHFLAKAEFAGVTSSLNVLDLTPSRFVTTTSRRKGIENGEFRIEKWGRGGWSPGAAGVPVGGVRGFSVPRRRDGDWDAVGTMAGSAGATGAALGGVTEAVRRGSTVGSTLKRIGKLGAAGAILGGGSALLGRLVLGRPQLGEEAAYTKRGAAGGAIGGGVAGATAALAGVAALRRGSVGAAGKLGGVATWLKKAARTNRVAHAIVKKGKGQWVRAGLAGGIAGGAIGGYQGADDGSAVDVIRRFKVGRIGQIGQIGFAVPAARTRSFAELPLSGRLGVDRYRKKLQDEDADRGLANSVRAGLAGAAVGALMRGRPGWSASVGKRALAGAAGGAAAVQGVRVVTSGTKDAYGERSRTGKMVESLPALGGLAAAGVLAVRRGRGWMGRLPVGRMGGMGILGRMGNMRFSVPAARHKAPVTASRHNPIASRVVKFGGRDQLRGDDRRFVDPLDVASGARRGYDQAGREVQLPILHGQVLRSVAAKGQEVHRQVKRGVNLVRDVKGAATGERRTDGRGRPLKREWEKPWFQNLAGAAVGGAAVLGHAALMRRGLNPANRIAAGYRGAVTRGSQFVRERVNRVLPDYFPMSVPAAVVAPRLMAPHPIASRESGVVRFAENDPFERGWDLRDARGRSTRVFAPGSQRRERRGKEWYERVENQRRLALAGGALAAVAGTALGWKLRGLKRGVAKVPGGSEANVVAGPWRKQWPVTSGQ